MAKKITKKVKLAIAAGKATPAPPVGTVLGPLGINLQEFCTKYNDATRANMGDTIPVELTIYDDRTFDMEIKTSPASFLIKKYAKITSGSAKGTKQIVGKLTKAQVQEIAEIKKPDLNSYDLASAMKCIEGTAKNMGIEITE